MDAVVGEDDSSVNLTAILNALTHNGHLRSRVVRVDDLKPLHPTPPPTTSRSRV